MTTHDRDKIIAVAKEVGNLVTDWRLRESYEFDCYGLERFYTIAFAAGAASRDTEIAELVAACSDFINKMGVWNPPELDALRKALAATEPQP